NPNAVAISNRAQWRKRGRSVRRPVGPIRGGGHGSDLANSDKKAIPVSDRFEIGPRADSSSEGLEERPVGAVGGDDHSRSVRADGEAVAHIPNPHTKSV